MRFLVTSLLIFVLLTSYIFIAKPKLTLPKFEFSLNFSAKSTPTPAETPILYSTPQIETPQPEQPKPISTPYSTPNCIATPSIIVKANTTSTSEIPAPPPPPPKIVIPKVTPPPIPPLH